MAPAIAASPYDTTDQHAPHDRRRAWGVEMREVHRRLRDALALAREQLDGEHPEPAGLDPLVYCWGFCAALTGHHRGEDGALFPRLVAQHPELAPVVRALVRDHSMLDHLVGGLQRTLERGADREERLRHLDGIEAVMETHFRYEDRRLLGLLDGVDDDVPSARDLYGPLA